MPQSLPRPSSYTISWHLCAFLSSLCGILYCPPVWVLMERPRISHEGVPFLIQKCLDTLLSRTSLLPSYHPHWCSVPHDFQFIQMCQREWHISTFAPPFIYGPILLSPGWALLMGMKVLTPFPSPGPCCTYTKLLAWRSRSHHSRANGVLLPTSVQLNTWPKHSLQTVATDLLLVHPSDSSLKGTQ